MPKESYSKRHANTGQWLLDSAEFQTWLNLGDRQHSILWCPGDPAVGKTVITSIAVNHITENIGERRGAIVYIYCNYANAATFSVRNLLGSMLRQMVEQSSSAATIAELKTFLKESARNRNLTEVEFSDWIETLSKKFDVVYTFVDALDECPEIGRDSLLTRLQQYSEKNMRIFLTSRLNVDVTSRIPTAVRAEIVARDEDITAFVESKIQESRRVARFITKDPGLKRYMVYRIIRQSKGMFLLAGLQIEGLGNQTSVKGVRSALERLPTDLFAMYDQIIERIRDQSEENAELGLKVLSLVFGAATLLDFDELSHALAIQPGDTDFDFEALVDLDVLLSVTAGLVTYQVDNVDDVDEVGSIELVHHTLHEYFKANEKRLFPDFELVMAKNCLSYLSLNEFGSGKCATGDLLEKRKKDFKFLNYAATRWPYYLREVQMELMDQCLAFVQDSSKTSAWLQVWEWRGRVRRFSSGDLPLDPLFLAVHFHLSELFVRLALSRDIDTRNDEGETPLLRAVDVTPFQKGWHCGRTRFLRFTDLRPSPPFDAEQHAMVHLLLDRNADIDAKDPAGRTAAFRAVEKENSGVLSILLDRGADIDVRVDGGESLVHLAAENEWRVDIMQLLLDKGAEVNVYNKKHRSPVHVAMSHSNSVMLDCLIDNGAHFDIADEEGVTPLQWGARLDRPETVATLIKRGARFDFTVSTRKTPLHFAVSLESPPEPDFVEAVMRTQRVDVIDILGRTPLHHAYWTSSLYTNPHYVRHIDRPERMKLVFDVIRRLINGGASETIADAYGRIPKDYADCDRDGHHKWDQDYIDFKHTPTEDGGLQNPHETQTKDVSKSGEKLEADEERGSTEKETN